MAKFSYEADLKLIELVKQSPLIYDKSDAQHDNHELRELTWRRIGQALQIPAAEFAGIQCQIQFGDYNEEKHKAGFIENLREYLPEQYCSSWGMERRVLKEYSIHTGLNELEAKHLYTKNARELPTYGVTFFLVKERQKGKKKLVPRLLGISSENILRLDETTKEIIQSWPLTHVKTYHVGKSETFTLNFGDYSDKPYSVKTCEAFRIRDILEGYIDLIQRRKLAGYNIASSEHGYMGQENVCSGQGNMMQHVPNAATKLVQQSVVGPSRVLDHVPGQRISGMGTQICTAQQLVIAEMKNKQEKGVLKADVSMRKDMGVPFTRRLNRLNSNSVNIVNTLAGQSESSIEEAHKIANDMEADMPSIREGVGRTIEKQTSEEERRKLQDQLNQLDELIRILMQHTDPNHANPLEAEDAAKQIASLSTEMYFAIAPDSRRRSSILKSTRGSFIADERTEKNLRRASFIAATATTNHALDSAAELAAEEYRGPALSPEQIKHLERAAVDKLGKINAAIAHYLLAHSDPQNIDYAAAVNSLNTIHELMPDLARDGQTLACVKNERDRTELVNDIQELCAAAKHLCSLSGVEDPQKLQDAATSYAGLSGKLVYVFGKRGGKARADKENQIIDLTEKVVDKTSQLLNSAQVLAHQSPADLAAKQVIDAGAVTAHVAKRLMTQTTLNAPTIEEPHCKSALTAASEALASSAQLLASSWKPLVEHPSRHIQGEKLHHQAMELAQVLDDLREAYEDDKSTVTDSARKGSSSSSAKPELDPEGQRLKFINSLANVAGKWRAFEEHLDKPVPTPVSKQEALEAERRLSDRLGHLNAAVASLLAATTDRDNPDYKNAEAAVVLIDSLMPDIIKDSKLATANQDEASRAALLANIKELCATSKNICASAHGADPEALNDALIKHTDTSSKLIYVVNRRANPDRESQVIDATSVACGQVGALLSSVQQVSESACGERGRREALDARGAVADAARALFTVAQVTAPSISDPRCQSTLLNAVDKVASTTDTLEHTWKPLADGEHRAKVQALDRQRKALDQLLDRVRQLCQVSDDDIQQSGSVTVVGPMEPQRLQFIASMRGASDKLAAAQQEFNKPAMPVKGTNMQAVQDRLNQGLAQLNAAMATLLAATADRDNPDCATARQATDTITKLMPQLIKDTKTVSANKEESSRAGMLAEIQALCDATQNICASAYGDNSKGKNVAVAKFADASQKLVFVCNPRKKPDRSNKEMNLVKSACTEASALVGDVQALATGVGGARGRELGVKAAQLEAQAEALQHATQILGPSLQSAQSQEALLHAVSSLSNAGQNVHASVHTLKDDPKHGARAKDTLLGLLKLQEVLDQLRAVCSAPGIQTSQEQQKLQFIKSLEANKGKWADVQKELNKPVAPSRGGDTAATEARLCSRLAALDAAVASLLAHTKDRDEPSYVEAEKSVKSISELLPLIVQDTKTVSASKDESARAGMLAEIKALCDASERICSSSYGDDTKGVNEAVAKYSDASRKLMFVANPRVNKQKETDILEQAQSACGGTAALLAGVQQLSEGVGGDRGRELDAQGGRLADAAQDMLRTAQITSTSLSSPGSRSAMVSSVDSMQSSTNSLLTALEGCTGTQAQHLTTELQSLLEQLELMKKTCNAPDPLPPLPTSRPPPLPHKPPPHASHTKQTQEFLDRLRMEEGLGHSVPMCPSSSQARLQMKPAPPVRKTDEEKVHCPKFTKSLEDAGNSIKAHESRIMKQCRLPSSSGAALSHRDMMQKQTQLQHNLVLAGVEVANLVNANYADKVDYTAGLKSTKALPQLMTSIVEDGTQLADNLNEMARKAFLYDMLQLCDSGRKICEAGLSDRQKLNDAAVNFGDTSTKLLYVVSSDVDPTLEKEIISRAKAIGDSVSHLALDAGNVAATSGSAGGNTSGSAGGSVQHICDAGTACVDAAGKLVYTAKLTAPSIHETPCQQALVASTEALSDKLDTFKHSWAPLQADPQQAKTIAHLNTEAGKLEELVRTLRSDVVEGTLASRRQEERLVVEDTPIRQLAAKILDEARYHTESSSSSLQDKAAYASYADKVTAAIRTLDIANALCKRSPHDTEKRRDLERAVQNLQMVLLQARPSRGEKGKTNIVDLMDFMEEVATEANNLLSAASTAKVPSAQDMLALEEIKDKCESIHSRANRLIRGEVDSELDFNDLFDQFGQDCEDTIKRLNAGVRGMEDTKTKRLLQSNVMALSESCNMLRFATKSGISTEACCSLDAALDQLDDIEARVIPTLVQQAANNGVTLRAKQLDPSPLSPATMQLCREVTSSPAGVAASTVTAYIADAASRSDGSLEDKNKLLKHLYKLVHLLKTQTVSGSVRAATWQDGEGPHTGRLTEQILQEIYKPESKFGVKSVDTKHNILEEDIYKLLIPSAPKILGDNKQQEDKLTHFASQLSATCSNLSHSVSRDSPGDASRELSHLSRVAVDQARELDGIARGVHITDPVQRRRIDEAAKQMSFATYNLLKTAESACLEPKNVNLKRRLANALQNLNHSIDKLVHHSSTSPVLSRACGALSRAAVAQLAALEARPTAAAPFSDTCGVLETQGEHIYKLKSSQALPRKEFMRALDDIGTAVRTSVECAEQCAYFIAVSDKNKDIAKSGLVDVPQIQKLIESIQDTCIAVIGSSQIDQAKEQKEDLHKRVSDLSSTLEQAQMLVKDGEVKRTLVRARSCVGDAAGEVQGLLDRGKDMEQIIPKAVSLLEALSTAHGLLESCPLVPAVGDMSTDTKAKCDDVINHSKSLLTNTIALIKDVQTSAGKSPSAAAAAADDDDEMMTWVTFNTNRKKLLDAYDALLKTVRRNGHRVGIYEKPPEEEEMVQTKKSYIEIQVDLANKWLKSPSCKHEVKTTGQQATRNVIDMARQMSEDLKGVEREELRGVVSETEELLAECITKYELEKYSVLMERVKELRKCIQRGVVTRVVEDFIEAEAPLADLDLLTDIEQDDSKRKFILERKIASLLAQLGRVTKTARFVANASQQQSINLELTQCSEQTELLAPMLVQAAQQRIDNPDDKMVIENYRALLAQYAESISKVRDLCDRAVDPMDFVQTAGETMQRMREDMTQQSTDTQKCAHASSAISRLANRVINVSMSSNAVASDPELQRALVEAKARLHAATPASDTRASRLPDWRDTTAEILRTTGEVECVLGGENIFKKGPTTANQPIFSVAQSLHESVKEWSSRDNEIVGVARRMAVLMARLSEYMETDKKDALIATSKSIVAESQEVTELAKKLAHECTDLRIKKNLLQTCERIPTISGQLKMLTTVKASSLGQQAVEEDKEAMDMLVGNAQSLMMSISEVVKAAASASVKIMSQRGTKLRWVRKLYY